MAFDGLEVTLGSETATLTYSAQWLRNLCYSSCLILSKVHMHRFAVEGFGPLIDVTHA